MLPSGRTELRMEPKEANDTLLDGSAVYVAGISAGVHV